MKKALALVLALVLALSMGVSAFAANLYVDLVPAVPATDETIYLYDDVALNDSPVANDTTKLVNSAAGGVFYEVIDLTLYKDVTVSATGKVSAELVDFNPEKMDWVNSAADKTSKLTYSVRWDNGEKEPVNIDKFGYDLSQQPGMNQLGYEAAVAEADRVNMLHDTTQYVVVCDQSIKLIKVTVEENYTAHFIEGSYTVKATRIADKVAVTGTVKVVNDVVIFGYENVKSAAKYFDDKEALTLGTIGYSDYETYKAGYKQANLATVLNKTGAYVVSTTAFRAIEGEDLAIEMPNASVVIDGVEAGQKGVNFTPYGYKFYKKDGKPTTDTAGDAASIKFGFYGNQVIKGDFTIAIAPSINWFELREAFGLKVEEDDIVSYYLLKDGKLVKEYKIDYMTIDYSEDLVLELELKDTTLGQYELVLEVPSAEVAGESNPNTGAESVVGVVAALAVVSLASAAAVSLKK